MASAELTEKGEVIPTVGLFTVAIFGPFLASFWLHFWIIFIIWQKND
jgi:hypothetical protein